jgi:hypothetical protein
LYLICDHLNLAWDYHTISTNFLSFLTLPTNQETHLLFVDLTKAYDGIPILKLWEVLGESNINITLIKALQNLYGTSENWKPTIPPFQYY